MSLTDINARLASIWTEIIHIKVDIDNIYIYLETLFLPLFFPPCNLQQILENIKRAMDQHPWLDLPSDPDEDI